MQSLWFMISGKYLATFHSHEFYINKLVTTLHHHYQMNLGLLNNRLLKQPVPWFETQSSNADIAEIIPDIANPSHFWPSREPLHSEFLYEIRGGGNVFWSWTPYRTHPKMAGKENTALKANFGSSCSINGSRTKLA